MIKVGEYNTLKVDRLVEPGAYLDDGKDGLLLPRRFVPKGTQPGDALTVFVYHDSEGRIIATTQKPKGIAGDIVLLRCVSTTPQGAFLDWGLMKDIFVARSQQINRMYPSGDYLVKIYIDEKTGRIAASEKIDFFLSNEELTVKEMDVVNLTVYRQSDLGYVMIINNRHTGLLHNNEVFRRLETGDTLKGFIKKIYPENNNIDVVLGKPGYERVEDESEKILRLLHKNKGFLPYHDKTDPETIYEVFGMSKKTFKMTVGALYKQRKIVFTEGGIKLAP
jgi:predicted RNA-binding protein (virulence factor B family)